MENVHAQLENMNLMELAPNLQIAQVILDSMLQRKCVFASSLRNLLLTENANNASLMLSSTDCLASAKKDIMTLTMVNAPKFQSVPPTKFSESQNATASITISEKVAAVWLVEPTQCPTMTSQIVSVSETTIKKMEYV